MKKVKISLMLNFGRSGGTILNKCLALLPDTIVLSEVNKLGGGSGLENLHTVKSQVKSWYDIDLVSEGFESQVLELSEICEKTKKHLIIRDWVYVNFFPITKNQRSPSYELETYNFLRKHFEVSSFLFIRDTIDCWISFGTPEIDLFMNNYNKFIEAVSKTGMPVFHYEDFVLQPKKELGKICDSLSIPYHDVTDVAHLNKNVNGDIQTRINSRGQNRNIGSLSRKIIPYDKIKLINAHPQVALIGEQMNYNRNYFSRVNMFTYAIKRTLQILKRYYD